MSIYCDFRKKELRDCQFVFLAIRPSGRHFAYTKGIACADIATAQEKIQNYEDGFIVKLHKRTIGQLKKMHPYKLGYALSYHLRNRQDY